jgi:predicted 3-demethylubiquinone-9 3-methyltransferase (glyoxalase superfamily)
MQKIRPHLWFDTQAVEAASFYAETFPDSKVADVSQIHDTPSGDVDIVSFEVLGQGFQAISAGPLFRFNPSVSFLVRCQTADEVDALWKTVADGGSALMPLDTYPFSKRYGWTTDRYGLSWQLMLDERASDQQLITMLMFVGDVCGKAEDAMRFYTSLLPDSRIDELDRYEGGEGPDVAGTIRFGAFTLGGRRFAAMDSAHQHDFAFNEAISLMVSCDTQEEIDRYWEALSAVPEAEQCGWLKDRFGLSWQIVPSAMDEMLRKGQPDEVARVTEAFLQMKKFDIAELERARVGA